MSDLFHPLHITHADGITPGERVDLGWRAWRSRAPRTQAGRWRRLRFWLALWRFFGRQQFLVQVDDHYLMATSLRVLPGNNGDITVTLMQRTSIVGHCLRYAMWHRRSPFQQTLNGHTVCISQPSPRSSRPPALLVHCPTALLDDHYALNLPLRIARSS